MPFSVTCRHNIILYIIVLVSCGVCAIALMAIRLIQYSHPTIAISPSNLDLGDGIPNELMSGRLTLRNSGNAPLKYRITKSCGCTKVDPDSGTLDANKFQILKVNIRLPSYLNSQRSASITIKSNDIKRPSVTCTISANCPAPIRVTPTSVEFSEVMTGEVSTETRVVVLESLTNAKTPHIPKFKAVNSSGNFIIQRYKNSDGKQLLKLHQKNKLPKGDYYDDIVFQSEDPLVNSLRISIHVRVVDPIQIIPTTVFLRKDPKTKAFFPVELLVSMRGSNSRLPMENVYIVDNPGGVRLEASSSKGKIFQRYSLYIDSKQWKGSANLEIGSMGSYGRSTLNLIGGGD